jgi:hypothetical protein
MQRSGTQNGGRRNGTTNQRKKNGGNGNGNGNGRKNGNGNGNGRKNGRVNYFAGQTLGLGTNMANVRPMRNGMQTFSGSDFLTTITIKAAPTLVERVLIDADVSPSAFVGTRMTQMSQLYERYRFRSFALRWVPAIPTTLACQLLLYIDTDPQDEPEALTADVLIRQATAQTGSQQWNFHMPKRISMAIRADDQLYYTGNTKNVNNTRFNLMGRAFLIQVTDPINFDGKPLTEDIVGGSIYIDWCCMFQTPQINPAGYLVTGGGETITSVPYVIEDVPGGATERLVVSSGTSTARANRSFLAVLANDSAANTRWTSTTNITGLTGNQVIRPLKSATGQPGLDNNYINVNFIASDNSWYVDALQAQCVGTADSEGRVHFDVKSSTGLNIIPAETRLLIQLWLVS